MKSRHVLLVGLLPCLAYLAITEVMYQLWQQGAASASGPGLLSIVGALISVLFTLPGQWLRSYEISHYLITFFGYGAEAPYGYHRRWIDFHVSMFLTAGVILAISICAVVVVQLTQRRKDVAA